MKPFIPVSLIIFFLFLAIVSGVPKVANHFGWNDQVEDTTSVVESAVYVKGKMK